MKKGINYWAFQPESDGSPRNVVDAMQEARDIGFDCFEPTVEETGLISLTTGEREAEKVRLSAERIGVELITLASGLAWGSPATHPDEEVREKAIGQSLKIIEIAAWLGVDTVLYVPGMVSAVFIPDFPPQPYDKVYARAEEALKRILPEAEKRGVRLGIENVWNRFLLSPLEMRDFIDSLDSPFVDNSAKKLAHDLKERMIVLIAAEHLIGASHGFKNMLNENSKTFAVRFSLPEMNHHLLEGLAFPAQNKQVLKFLFLVSDLYDSKIEKRIEITRRVIEKNGIETKMKKINGQTRLSQVLSLLYLGSFTSAYLAFLNNLDPAPIPWVDYFKKALKKNHSAHEEKR